jgi:hypothetical protein
VFPDDAPGGGGNELMGLAPASGTNNSGAVPDDPDDDRSNDASWTSVDAEPSELCWEPGPRTAIDLQTSDDVVSDGSDEEVNGVVSDSSLVAFGCAGADPAGAPLGWL